MKKGIICVLVCMLMIVSTIIPVSATTVSEKTSHPLTKGNTLYVGGSGPNNYTKIQDAINDASHGDSIFVYGDSSPYFESLIVDQSISLIGEDRHTTVIDGGEAKNSSVVNITADGVMVQGFTIQNSSSLDGWPNYVSGIEILSEYNIIKDNIIKDNYVGIQVGGWTINTSYYNHSIIDGNDIYENYAYGVYILTNYNTISHNRISSNKFCGLYLSYSRGNLVSLNNITKNGKSGTDAGIFMVIGKNNTIFNNNIVDNHYGLFMTESRENSFLQNNIYDNVINAFCEDIMLVALISRLKQNTWDGNYWGTARQLPKAIFGHSLLLIPSMLITLLIPPFLHYPYMIPISLPLIKFDWHPAQEPYDIPALGT